MTNTDFRIISGAVTACQPNEPWQPEMTQLMDKIIGLNPHVVMITGLYSSQSSKEHSAKEQSFESAKEAFDKQGYFCELVIQQDKSMPGVLFAYRKAEFDRPAAGAETYGGRQFVCQILRHKTSKLTYAVTGCDLHLGPDADQSLPSVLKSVDKAQEFYKKFHNNETVDPDVRIAAGRFEVLQHSKGQFKILEDAGFKRDATQKDVAPQTWVQSRHSITTVSKLEQPNLNKVMKFPFVVTDISINKDAKDGKDGKTATTGKTGTTSKGNPTKKETLWETAKRLFLLFLENLWRVVSCKEHPKESKV